MRTIAVLTALIAIAAQANSAPTVFVDPPSAVVEVGQDLNMSIRVDAGADTLTCFLVGFSFDASVVELVSASEGSLFSECGCATMFAWDQNAPGLHSCNDVTLGFDCFVMCPGELADLQFVALEEGATAVAITMVDLRDIRRNPILPVYTSGAEITVESGSGVDEAGAVEKPMLTCHPNPFVSETLIELRLPPGESDARVVVYDTAGRVVARPTLRYIQREHGSASWAGDAVDGRPLPSGVYFVVATGSTGGARERVTLIR
jgi:hypothetical protein